MSAAQSGTSQKVVVVGSGNIGTDLARKIMRSPLLSLAGMVGIDPDSDGLRRVSEQGIRTTAGGVAAMLEWPDFDDVAVVFDATSARAHLANWALLEPTGTKVIDLTPAAIGPFTVPGVTDPERASAQNVNMVTCGGQATVPIVAAVNSVAPVRYAEIVASISSRSAGPGTRANIDEFTVTTRKALEQVGGAEWAKAVIVLNPSDPPVLMRNTVHCLVDDIDHDAVRAAIAQTVARVSEYVPGYRLKQEVLIERVSRDTSVWTLAPGLDNRDRWKVSTYLEVEGAADYLPAYAGNLDIMTAAAVRVAEEAVTTGGKNND